MEQLKTFYSLWREINVVYEDMAKRLHMSYFEVLVLQCLLEEPGFSQNKIAREYFLPKQTVNSILSAFSEDSLIFFESDEKDKRRKLVFLTEKGESYAKEITEKFKVCEERAFLRLGLEKSEAFLSNMELFTAYLKEESGNGTS